MYSHGTSLLITVRYRRNRGPFRGFANLHCAIKRRGVMAIPTLLAPFNATFDPDPDEGYQFTLSDAGGPLNNAFFVPEEGGTVEITLTNATFADPSIIWSNPLDGPAPPPTEGGTKITLPVTAPGIF